MDYRRAREKGGVYFFTVVTHQRKPLFSCEENIVFLKRAISRVKERHSFQMPAYVILPDHLHCIWQLPQGDDDFSTRWRLIKHSVSCATVPVQFWQNRFWEHLIRDEEDYRRHVDYIHINPVKHGVVNDPAMWPHGSFVHYVKNGSYPADWGKDAYDIEGEFGE